MSDVSELSCNVVGKKTYAFKVQVLLRKTNSERIPEDFYTDANVEVPKGDHYELLLLESPVWGKHDGVPIHIYVHPEAQANFVCYTGSLPTIEGAKDLFEVWCLGTVYSLEQGEDFGLLHSKHPTDFKQILGKKFNITSV